MMNNIKNSFSDIYGYINYMCKKLVRFWLVVLILIIVCYLVSKFIPKDTANNFWGVIISIIAAVLFEGYRSYRKYIESTIVINSCFSDIKRLFEKFFNTFDVECRFSLVHLHTTAGIEEYPVTNKSIIENLKISLSIISKLDEMMISLNKDKENFDECIKTYSAFKNSAKKVLILDFDSIVNTLSIYSADPVFVKNMYELRRNVLDVTNNDIWPDAFYDGQPANVNFIYIMKILEKMIYTLEYIENGKGKGDSMINMMNVIKNHLVTIAVVFFVIAIFMPFVTIGLYIFPYSDSFNGIMRVSNVGETADFLAGTMTPFLTIAAFFLLLKGYFMQKEELTNTREEMKRSAEELKQQRQIMEAEKNLSKSQKDFEFSVTLISDLRRTFSNIEIPFYDCNIDENNKEVVFLYDKGLINMSFEEFCGCLGNLLVKKVSGINSWNDFDKIKHDGFYQGSLKNHIEYVISACAFNYYSKIYFILNFIDNEILNENTKRLVLNYLQANITLSEKVMLIQIREKNIRGVCENDEKFISLLSKYEHFI